MQPQNAKNKIKNKKPKGKQQKNIAKLQTVRRN